MKTDRIQSIIIDDEPGCTSYLQYCLENYCPQIQVIGTGSDTNDFLQLSGNKKIDIAFLDVQLDREIIFNAFQQVHSFPFQIVFVTAYDFYAVKAIKMQAFDYILKPLLKQEIVECYEKIKKHFNKKETNDTSQDYVELQPLFIKTGSKIDVVPVQNILYFKAKGPYTEVYYLANNKACIGILSKPLGSIEQEYNKPPFYRIHKSFFINVRHITQLIKQDTYYVKIGEEELIQIAQRRVNDFLTFYKTQGH
ncbi:MAG: response regulator transcription factor [Bacteroidetes bacterium]|nr:response regulator transcription factor [Bacteroidota bacterium]